MKLNFVEKKRTMSLVSVPPFNQSINVLPLYIPVMVDFKVRRRRVLCSFFSFPTSPPPQKSKQKLRFLLNKTAAQTVAAIMKKLKVKDVSL